MFEAALLLRQVVFHVLTKRVPKTDPLWKLLMCFRKYGLHRQRYLVFVCVYQVPMNKFSDPDTNKKDLTASS